MTATAMRSHSRPPSASRVRNEHQVDRLTISSPIGVPPRRAAVPRAASTPNMYSLAAASSARPIAREEIDLETSRALVRFFRTTEPPLPMREPSLDIQPDCFGSPSLSLRDKRRFSLQSLRRGKRGKGRPSSLIFQHPQNTVPSTTAAGHAYMAISAPAVEEYFAQRRISLQSRLLDVERTQSLTSARVAENGWPHRQSSKVSRSTTASPVHDQSLQVGDSRTNSLRRGGDADDVASIASSLQMYGNMLRLLSPTPVDADKPVSPPRVEINEVDNERPGRATTPVATTTPKMAMKPVRHRPSVSVTTDVTTSRPSSSSRANSRRSPTQEAQSPAQRASSVPPKLSHSRSLSAFPNISQAMGSPPAKQHKKPPNLLRVASALEVPKTASIPESPGFPTMLAAMTFPSPPESSPSHSTKNSISSNCTSRPVVTPPNGPKPSALSNLDRRLLESSRPPPRGYKSESGHQLSHVPAKSLTLSIASSHVAPLDKFSQASPSDHRATTPVTKHDLSPPGSANSDATARPIAVDPSEVADPSSDLDLREGYSSMTDTDQSETATDSHHLSMASDTTVTTDLVLPIEGAEQPSESRRASQCSQTILDKKRSRWSLAHSETDSQQSRDQSMEDDRRTRSSIRSESASSTGTTGATQSLAERRSARRAKIKEKLHRDLNASMVKNLRVPDRAGIADAVDSPVLGWFSQDIASGPPATAKRMSIQGPSPLAQSMKAEASPKPQEESLNESNVESKASDVTLRIETSTANEMIPDASGKHANNTSDKDIPSRDADQVTDPKTPISPSLALSPIMVSISYEGRSPTSPLRPLSLLTQGSPSSISSASSLRPESRSIMRQRPVPISIAKTVVDKNGDKSKAKSTRKSVPNMPTPPLSPDFSSSRRMSLPSQASPPRQQHRPTSSHPWPRPSIDSQLPVLSREQETQWLRAHQRETAQEWRLAALKERMRIERLTKGKTLLEPEPRVVSGHQSVEDADTPSESEGSQTRTLREKHSNSSINSATTRGNRLDALKLLNGNASNNDSQGPSVSFADDEVVGKTASTDGVGAMKHKSLETSIEQRLSRLEKSGDQWVDVVMPLLQDMNKLLKQMHRESRDQLRNQTYMKEMAPTLALDTTDLEESKETGVSIQDE